MLTEEQARTKWCPFARPLRLDSEQWVHPHTEDGLYPVNCIASDCMAWRWGVRAGGYCGLAGAPHD